jgi:hypothetical protein
MELLKLFERLLNVPLEMFTYSFTMEKFRKLLYLIVKSNFETPSVLVSFLLS